VNIEIRCWFMCHEKDKLCGYLSTDILCGSKLEAEAQGVYEEHNLSQHPLDPTRLNSAWSTLGLEQR
jgi:hypothetical protein